MKITISGKPGSGKSTVAKELANKLEFNHFSTGNFMRDLAKEKGITLLQLSAEAENNKEIDQKIDSWSETIGEADENFVMDSRLAFAFIPTSIKIFLDVSEAEAAKRIFKNKRDDEKENINFESTFENIKKRFESEKKRYQEYYGLDYTNPNNYDLLIDTTDFSVEEIVKKILDFLKKEYPEGKA